jgi:hypothetical protein
MIVATRSTARNRDQPAAEGISREINRGLKPSINGSKKARQPKLPRDLRCLNGN